MATAKLLNKKPFATVLRAAACVVSVALAGVAVWRPELADVLYPVATLIFGSGVVRRPGDVAR